MPTGEFPPFFVSSGFAAFVRAPPPAFLFGHRSSASPSRFPFRLPHLRVCFSPRVILYSPSGAGGVCGQAAVQVSWPHPPSLSSLPLFDCSFVVVRSTSSYSRDVGNGVPLAVFEAGSRMRVCLSLCAFCVCVLLMSDGARLCLPRWRLTSFALASQLRLPLHLLPVLPPSPPPLRSTRRMYLYATSLSPCRPFRPPPFFVSPRRLSGLALPLGGLGMRERRWWREEEAGVRAPLLPLQR